MEWKVERIQVQPMDDKRAAISVFYHGLENPQLFSPPQGEVAKIVTDFLAKSVTRYQWDKMLQDAAAAQAEEPDEDAHEPLPALPLLKKKEKNGYVIPSDSL